MMISSLSTNLASAKHVHRHNKITAFKYNCKPLKFNQLIKIMNKDYKLYTHTTLRNNNKNRERLSSRYYRMIMYTLWANLRHYNKAQLQQICENPDSKVDVYAVKRSNHISELANEPSIYEYIKGKDFKKTNEVFKLSQQDNKFDTQIRKYLIKDINKTRAKYKKKPLIVDNIMQKVANYQAPKVLYAFDYPEGCLKYEHLTKKQLNAVGGTTDNWVHGEDTHTSGADHLRSHDYDPNNWSANAGALGYTQPINIHKYKSSVPKGIASDIDTNYVNYDNFYPEYNGHRKNELDPYAKYLGVGVAYDPNTQLFVNDEQFYE